MGWKKLLVVIGLLLALLIIPVFSILRVVDFSKLSLISAPASSTVEPAFSSTSTPIIFVDPAAISDETLQSGSYFEVHVNISDVTDLFAWQINMSWDSSILSVSNIIVGEFLLRTTSENKTAADQLGFVINKTDNAEGYTAMSESILGGVPGISGNGTLVSIEFLVIGYGSTDLTISLTGNLATTLLSSTFHATGETLSFTKTDGYFRNKYPGDIDGDKYVGSADFSVLAGAYGVIIGDPAYNREVDFDLDGYIGSADFSVLAGNYGKTFP